jgi:Tfp pilus assembly protein PilN
MIDINLLGKKEEEKPTQKEETPTSPILTIVIMILVLVALAILSLFIYKQARGYKLSRLLTREKKLEDDIDKINKIEEDGTIYNLEERAKTVQNQLKNLQKLVASHIYWSYLLTELTTSTHKEAQYESFSVDKDNTITISGNTSSYVTLAYFLASLDKNKKIENVRLNSASLSQTKEGKMVTKFSIKFSLTPEALQKETKYDHGNK